MHIIMHSYRQLGNAHQYTVSEPLICTIVMCYYVIKFYQPIEFCSAVVNRRRVARFMSFAIYITFFYLFWKLGDPFPMLSAKHGMIYYSVCKCRT